MDCPNREVAFSKSTLPSLFSRVVLIISSSSGVLLVCTTQFGVFHCIVDSACTLKKITGCRVTGGAGYIRCTSLRGIVVNISEICVFGKLLVSFLYFRTQREMCPFGKSVYGGTQYNIHLPHKLRAVVDPCVTRSYIRGYSVLQGSAPGQHAIHVSRGNL